MASKTATTAETETLRDDAPDTPLADSDQAVKKMLAKGKERGYVTYDELNAVLPQDRMSSEQIEDTMSMLSELGINLVESEDDGEESAKPPATKTTGTGTEVERTDDPVRMYLREMGSIELLSREGEISIAKRIEAGREVMIGGICESPLTMRAIVSWREEIKKGSILLRDIIDLEASLGTGPAGANANAANAQPQEPGKAEAKPAAHAKDGPADANNTDDDDDDEDDGGRHGGNSHAEGSGSVQKNCWGLQEIASPSRSQDGSGAKK